MNTAKLTSSVKSVRYKTPRRGTSIHGHLAQCLRETVLLKPVAELLPGNSARALSQIALYAASTSIRCGPPFYPPPEDRAGTAFETTDPETRARFTVLCGGGLRFASTITLPGVGTLAGARTSTGNTLSLNKLDAPALSIFDFTSTDEAYHAKLVGILMSEPAPCSGRTRTCAFGTLDLSDSAGNRGRLTLDSSGLVFVSVTSPDGTHIHSLERLAK